MISTTGEYALRAAVYLAQHAGLPQTSAQIAQGTKVPASYLSKVLQAMAQQDLITSQRGLHGGFVLARPAETISILEILASVDAAPQRIKKCPLGIEGHLRLCPLHRLLDQSIAYTEQQFTQTCLDSLTRSAEGVTPLCESAGLK